MLQRPSVPRCLHWTVVRIVRARLFLAVVAAVVRVVAVNHRTCRQSERRARSHRQGYGGFPALVLSRQQR